MNKQDLLMIIDKEVERLEDWPLDMNKNLNNFLIRVMIMKMEELDNETSTE